MEISYHDIYNKMVKISVIVPVYNVVSCISRCIDSIIEQTLTDWELLLIDDGSSDGSALICDDYSSKDKRIKVFHKENGGVSSARNLGIEQASGDWIVFVDSDDWCEQKYLSDFFCTSVELSDSDIVLQGRKDEIDGRIDSNIVLENGIYSNIAEGLLKNNLLTFGAPYCKLYPNKLIKKYHIRFPEEYSYGEDTTFFFTVLTYVNCLITINKCNYHYMESGSGSLSKKDHDFKPLSDFLRDSLTLVNTLDSKYNARGILVSSYMPNYRSLLLRSIVNMYRLRYTKTKIKHCLRIIKNELLPSSSYSNDFRLLFIRYAPIWLLIPVLNVIMKLYK